MRSPSKTVLPMPCMPALMSRKGMMGVVGAAWSSAASKTAAGARRVILLVSSRSCGRFGNGRLGGGGECRLIGVFKLGSLVKNSAFFMG